MLHLVTALLHSAPVLSDTIHVTNVTSNVTSTPVLTSGSPSPPACSASIDKTWLEYLEKPPAMAKTMASELQSRAEEVAKRIKSETSWWKPLTLQGDYDVVASGGGDLNAYYLGVMMVLRRLGSAAGLREQRLAGASGGGWMSFELVLKGEATTLENYLSYGLLEEENPIHFNILNSVFCQAADWRIMAKWQANKWADGLPALNERVHLALSCTHSWWSSKRQFMVDKYATPEQAALAFIGTGATWEIDYDGMTCSDGADTSGPIMAPLFQDKRRQQLIVDLMKTPGSLEMAAGKYTSKQFHELVAAGQDEAAEFLLKGKVARQPAAITLCPKDAYDVSGMVCKKHWWS